jgi:hypothetical protein
MDHIGTQDEAGARPECSTRGGDAGDAHQAALRLCAALDRAVALGLLEHADRLSLTAAGLACAYTPLAERIARLRLRQGRTEAALAVIDGCGSLSASIRFLRVACLMHLGRACEAHSELQQWCRRSTAPLDARVLLALLEWRGGDARAATVALHRNLKHLEHPRTLQMLTLLAAAVGRDESALAWAARWCQADGTFAAGDCEPVLRTIGVPTAPASHGPVERRSEQLALELIGCEPAIGVLVEAQRWRPEPAAAAMLARAIEIALPDLAQRPAAMESLVRLALAHDDRIAALRWAERGLALHPRSASLTLLVQDLRGSDGTGADEITPASVLASIGHPHEHEQPAREQAA